MGAAGGRGAPPAGVPAVIATSTIIITTVPSTLSTLSTASSASFPTSTIIRVLPLVRQIDTILMLLEDTRIVI